jgi:hypothetical protein
VRAGRARRKLESDAVFDRSDIDLLVERSMAGSGLLDEIVRGARSSDEDLAWDCTELLRRVAESSCGLVEPYRYVLEVCTGHPSEHVREEAEAALEAVRRCGAGDESSAQIVAVGDDDDPRRGRWHRPLSSAYLARHDAN